MEKPQYYCGSDDCCLGRFYPACQEDAKHAEFGGLNTREVTESRFVYDPDQEYTHHTFTD